MSPWMEPVGRVCAVWLLRVALASSTRAAWVRASGASARRRVLQPVELAVVEQQPPAIELGGAKRRGAGRGVIGGRQVEIRRAMARPRAGDQAGQREQYRQASHHRRGYPPENTTAKPPLGLAAHYHYKGFVITRRARVSR